MVNPYQPPATANDDANGDASRTSIRGKGIDGISKLLRRGLLHRRIEVVEPLAMRLDYDGKWFRQRVFVDDQCPWYRVSWLTIHRSFYFELPDRIDPQQRRVQIQMAFYPLTLLIRRFTVTLGDTIVYDEGG
jgi:hypothetical protein